MCVQGSSIQFNGEGGISSFDEHYHAQLKIRTTCCGAACVVLTTIIPESRRRPLSVQTRPMSARAMDARHFAPASLLDGMRENKTKRRGFSFRPVGVVVSLPSLPPTRLLASCT